MLDKPEYIDTPVESKQSTGDSARDDQNFCRPFDPKTDNRLNLQPNAAAMRAFLLQIAPEGPWHITRIWPAKVEPSPKDKRTAAGYFPDLQALDAKLDGIVKFNSEGWNLYFSVAQGKKKNGKYQKSDLHGTQWLHLDIDSSDYVIPGQLAKSQFPPNIINNSGNGYHAYWKLSEFVSYNEGVDPKTDPEKQPNLLAVEAACRGLLNLCEGADRSCWNADRIMRLPGTINWPKQEKRDAGAPPVMATNNYTNLDYSHPLEGFNALTSPQDVSAPKAAPRQTKRLQIGNFAPYEPKGEMLFEDIPELDFDQHANTMRIMIHGYNPDDPLGPSPEFRRPRKTGDDAWLYPWEFHGDPYYRPEHYEYFVPRNSPLVPDRSRWLFSAVVNLVRAGVSAAIIGSLLISPHLGFATHVLAQPRPAEYAKKQIVSAMEKAAQHDAANAAVKEQIQTSVEKVKAKKAADFETKDGKIIAKSQHNIRLALQQLGVRVSCDEFQDRMLIDGLKGFGPRLDDKAMNRLWLAVDERFKFHPTKDYFWSVVQDDAQKHKFHPVKNYLDGLEWDGQNRIDNWLVSYAGAEDTDYVRAVGRLMLIAAVRRIRQPGCKFDEMVVLEGAQGTQKSSALALLATHEDWFSDDLPLNADSKRVIEALAGRWIVEAAELNGLRKSGIEALKAFLSRRTDRARMSYDRLPSEIARQCVIVGTTNSSVYLKDDTGARRFWPVKVARFDLEVLARDKDQLWAEAAHREAQGESIRLDPSLWAEAAEEQQKRQLVDPFVEVLEQRLSGEFAEGRISSTDVFALLGFTISARTQEANDRVGKAMRSLGWERKRLRFVKGENPTHGYVRGDKAERINVRAYGDGQVDLYTGNSPEIPF